MTDRVTLLLIAVIAVIIARNPDSSVFNIVSFAWAGFGAVFGPVVLFALFWRRTNWQGALAGMVSGGVMVFVWKYLVRPNVSFLNFYELLPAFLDLQCDDHCSKPYYQSSIHRDHRRVRTGSEKWLNKNFSNHFQSQQSRNRNPF